MTLAGTKPQLLAVTQDRGMSNPLFDLNKGIVVAPVIRNNKNGQYSSKGQNPYRPWALLWANKTTVTSCNRFINE